MTKAASSQLHRHGRDREGISIAQDLLLHEFTIALPNQSVDRYPLG